MIYRFNSCTVEVDDQARRLTTIYPDGTTVEATGNTDLESVRLAHELGYHGDTWQLSRDHELLHHALADAEGLPHSPVLWAQAHGEKAGEVGHREECLVLGVQRLLRRGLDAVHGQEREAAA